ncbi:MAG TPA: hypothetical protein PLN33_17980 [Hyphomonadaceae bacterium]|nr:hypothetical protein [Hyphomonadaceae bacterium]HPN05115.1 hypothetical protein [Hyphomonadaceae bacterium]
MATAHKNNNGSVNELAGRVAEEMSDFSDKARRAFDETSDRAREFAGEAADQAVRGGKKAVKFVRSEVKEHPLRTLAIGAAVGAVVAAVIMLRKED